MMDPTLSTSVLAFLAADGLLAIDAQGAGRVAAARPDQRIGAVAVLPLVGVLVPRDRSSWFGTMPGMAAFRTRLSAAVNDPNIGSIIIEIDSPGGTVAGTAETAAAVRAAAAAKPTVAVVNTLAASAAYYIASQASEIVLAPDSEVGSIGVMTVHTDMTKAYEMAGIKPTLISAGRMKGALLGISPLDEDARANVQSRIDEAMDSFVGAVASGRRVSAETVREKFGEGAIVTMATALSVGMADRVATLEQVIAELSAGKGKSFQKRRSAAFA